MCAKKESEMVSRREAQRLWEEVFSQMLETRARKYQYFLAGLAFGIRILLPQRKRADIFRCVYASLRRADDVADGDIPNPPPHNTAPEFIERLISFVEIGGTTPEDNAEKLLSYAFMLAKEENIDISGCVRKILDSLLFDARRRNPVLQVFPARTLDEYFHRMDIEGTIEMCLLLTEENRRSVAHAHLSDLGKATRIYYTLRDLKEDTTAGLCNISQEDIHTFGISDVRDNSSKGILAWQRLQAQKGLRLLRQHRACMRWPPLIEMNLRTKAVLWFVYEAPAGRYFRTILRS